MIKCECGFFKDFKCMDCAVCTNCSGEYYMVTDQVWDSVAGRGMLCVGCLEQRRGKLLTKDEFTDCPLNLMNLIMGSTRLKSRLQNVAATAIV